MRREIPAIRILPMSDQADGVRGRSIEDVQQDLFLRRLPQMNGRWRYQKSGLNADPGTLVLFQFKARIIASALFLRDEKFDRPRRGSAGELHFDPATIRIFAPLDASSLRAVWPAFRAFGHAKQMLNPTLHSKFNRRLTKIQRPPNA